MNTDVFFTEAGQRDIRNGWSTAKQLYKAMDRAYRKAYWCKSQGDADRYFRLMEHLNNFSNLEVHFREANRKQVLGKVPGVVYWNLAINRFGSKTKYAKDRQYMKYRIEGCYRSIKAGLRTMEQRAEDAINMGLCWMCGEELVDKRLDECYRCRCNDECPTCHGDCVVGTGRYIRSWDWLEPPEELEKTCPDCNGRGDFDSYLEVNGVE